MKRLGPAFLAILIGIALASSYAEGNEDPWNFLEGFTHVPGAIARIDDRHVAAVFHEPSRNLKALVLFPASCRSRGCSLDEPVAYSVFDAHGLLIRLHEEPAQAALLQRLITAGSPSFTAA